MKSHTRLIIGLALLLTGVGGLLVMRSDPMPMGGMGMMGQGNMKEMMKRMMGDQLPSGIDASNLPDPQSRGARLMVHYCTQCHDLPPPVLHTSSEWPKVFARMDRRMEMMSRTGSILSPTDQERTIILNYLPLILLNSASPRFAAPNPRVTKSSTYDFVTQEHREFSVRMRPALGRTE